MCTISLEVWSIEPWRLGGFIWSEAPQRQSSRSGFTSGVGGDLQTWSPQVFPFSAGMDQNVNGIKQILLEGKIQVERGIKTSLESWFL